jgi:glycosyltransferase involved in cell wall biosynthesis
MAIRSIALNTIFKHHAAFGGYAQVMRYTRPMKVFGIDETQPPPNMLRRKYQWLYEFDAYGYALRNPVDLVHVLYGEDYFRFSSYLFHQTPVVATFHQPAERLKQDVEHGNLRGRVGVVTHRLTPRRYARLAAAIVLSVSQKEVLAGVMPPEKIHVIPHGVAVAELSRMAVRPQGDARNEAVVTVGQWLRDWDFYFQVVAYCAEHRPNWRFVLINRTLPAPYRAEAACHRNLEFLDGVDDVGLVQAYRGSRVLFLPVLSAAGNNAVMEALALGRPVLMTEGASEPHYDARVLAYYKRGDLQHAVRMLDEWMLLSPSAFEELSAMARHEGEKFDWRNIGARHVALFESFLADG